MNTTVSETIEDILKNTDPTVRDKVRLYLRACAFSNADDPMLNALAVQAVLANQPVRLAQEGGATVATEASLARLGDRLADSVRTVASLRIGTIILALAISLSGGIGLTALGFKLWGRTLAPMFDLPRAPDARLEELNSYGAELHVEGDKGMTAIYLKGDIDVRYAQTKDGLRYLYFKHQ